VIVFVGGGGAAGKSTFTIRLEKLLRGETPQIVCKKIELDRYFLPIESIGGRASDGKYDNPLNSNMDRAVENVRAISEGRWTNLTLPVHDRRDHKKERQCSEDATRFREAQVVIVEGLYALGPCFGDIDGIRIYIDASPTDRAKGRIWRDINVRKRSEQHVIEMLLGREAYHQTFVEPSQMVADYIIRRAPTEGALGVIDPAEVRECFIEACLKSGLDEEAAVGVFSAFEESQEKAKKRHARKTEF
jgi:uridine kinase